MRFVLRFLEAMQCRQRFLEVRWMPYRHRVGIHQIRTDPPIATIYINSQFNHGLSEPCITNEPIVNAQELSFLTLLLELIRSVIFLITFFLSVPVTVWSALPDVKVRDREEIKNGLDVLLVFCCIISYEVTARAVDDADVPIRQTCSALYFWLNIDYLA